MGRLIKYVIYLIVLCAIGIAGYALIFDLPAPQSEIVKPVETSLN
jgi:hypothetical protein